MSAASACLVCVWVPEVPLHPACGEWCPPPPPPGFYSPATIPPVLFVCWALAVQVQARKENEHTVQPYLTSNGSALEAWR